LGASTLVARTLHALSPRKDKPLVTLNCAAMPETMVESELFGHVKGAFTGAVSDKRGKFVLADKGTLFLDEIGDLSLSAQAKVLRAVQEGEVQPVGSEKTLRVDVRILAATHKDLEAEAQAGRFREDLLYRLRVLELWVPPLRERVEDIPLLSQMFLTKYAAGMGKRVIGFTPKALSALSQYRFPGNVRELKNEVERAVIVMEGGGEVVDVGDLSARITGGRGSRPSAPHEAPRPLSERFAALAPMEEALVKEALGEAKGNVAVATRLLGISRSMMETRMDRFGLKGSEPSQEAPP
jgi:Nif-specific regulatory protein